MRRILSLLAIVTFQMYMTPIYAETKLPDDLVSIGKPSSSANKRIKFKGTNQELRANTTTNKIEYTNDGTNYKPIGSGSGSGGSSGVNLLPNDSLEDGIVTGWTSSGGTFSSQTYSSAVEGDTKYARFVSSMAGQFVETTAVAIPTNFGAGCQADFKKVNVSTASAFKIQAMDTTGAIVYAEQVIPSSSWVKVPTISFPCPASGTLVKLRLASLLAATIDFDRGYFGSNQNLVSVSQNIIAGESYWATTSGCNLIRATSGTLGAFSTASSCPASTVVDQKLGTWLSVDVDKIQQTINNLPAGEYKATFFLNQSQSVNNGAAFTIFDGTTTCLPSGGNGSAAANAATVVSCIFKYTSAGNRVFEPYASNTSGNVSINNEVSNFVTKFQLERWASSNEVAVSNEQASWFIDANMGGANIGLGTAAQSSYIEVQNVNLDLVNNTSKGSASVEIACAAGTASSGPNCGAAAESVGIAFIPPSPGLFEVCASYTQTQTDSGDIVYQLIETSNLNATIIQEGGMRLNNTAPAGVILSSLNCGTFNFADTSKRTIRLMYEKTSTTGNPNLVADRSATSGQRDMKWTVRPLLSAFHRPVFVDPKVVLFSGAGSGSVSLPSSVSTVIPYTAQIDTHGGWNAGTNAWTVPTGQSGYYEINASVTTSVPVNATYPISIDIQVNGVSKFSGGRYNEYTTAALVQYNVTPVKGIYLNAGDVVRAIVFQTSGTTGTMAADTFKTVFNIKKLYGN